MIESALLPTVAYLAGPSELRYLALTPPVYQRMRIPRQLALPRWSGILVEPRVDRVLQKFNIELDDLLAPAGALEARLVRSQLPDEAAHAIERLRADLETGYEALGRSATEIDPTLARPVQGARNQGLSGVHDIERKLLQHLKRRQEIELGQITKARADGIAGQSTSGATTHRGAVFRALWTGSADRAQRSHRGLVCLRP